MGVSTYLVAAAVLLNCLVPPPSEAAGSDKKQEGGRRHADSGEDSGVRTPEAALEVLRRMMLAEAQKPTTSANVRTRLQTFTRAVIGTGTPGVFIAQQDYLDIATASNGGDLKKAASLLHKALVELSRKNPGNSATGRTGPGAPADPPAPQQGSAAGAADVLRRLLADEKGGSPTTAENVKERIKTFYDAIQLTDRARELAPTHPRYFIQRIQSGRNEEVAEAASKLREMILNLEPIYGAKTEAVKALPRPKEWGPEEANTGESDKSAANVLYYKAMQFYAEGDRKKAVKLLGSAAKLDPESMEIVNALKRLEAETSPAPRRQ